MFLLFSTVLTLEGLRAGFFAHYPKYVKRLSYRPKLHSKKWLKSRHGPSASTLTTTPARNQGPDMALPQPRNWKGRLRQEGAWEGPVEALAEPEGQAVTTASRLWVSTTCSELQSERILRGSPKPPFHILANESLESLAKDSLTNKSLPPASPCLQPAAPVLGPLSSQVSS